MIVVSNTKELEKYGLDRISDNEHVRILGGMKGKAKYEYEKYLIRTTYTGRQIKQIINQMQLIENSIPKEWNEWQRAKYIYEVLGRYIEYNHNKEDHNTQQCSNLTILLSRSGICAGYALLYKEMMDRQGIQCDYIRGIVPGTNGNEKHAWNVLTINGQSFPVDLTWDSAVLRRGENELQYFGVDANFHNRHIAERDENVYNYVEYNKEYINSIDTNPNARKKEITVQQKLGIIQLAIEETYRKFKIGYGAEFAQKQVKGAIEKYINNGDGNRFTRNENARQQLLQYVTSDEMLSLIAESYVKQIANNSVRSILDNSVYATFAKYGEQQAISALVDYIKMGKTMGFTRENEARYHLMNITREDAMNWIIAKVAEEEIKRIEISEKDNQAIIDDSRKKYFYGDEFAKIQLSPEKSKSTISKAVEWIKERLRTNKKKKEEPKRQKENEIKR